MKPRTVYIGVDDTDVPGSPGTGRVARGLAQALLDGGLAKPLGVSRHQLLIDSRVRCTSHNSAKGLALASDAPEAAFYAPAEDYLRSCFIEGSDPGLCICPEERVNRELLDYAVSAQTTLLGKEDALGLASRHGIFLRGLGGDGGGVIGALAAAGLRAAGNDGRLVDLRGIKEIKGVVSVRDILERTDIVRVQDLDGNLLGAGELVDSRDWLRPSLVGGQPVLRVKPGTDRAGRPVWLGTEKKFREMIEEKERSQGASQSLR